MKQNTEAVAGTGIRRHAPIQSAGTRALVLSGGGITGFLYEIGVLAALEQALAGDLLHQRFDFFVGTSAGAIVASLLANGAPVGEIYSALHDDLDSPYNFRPRDVFGLAGGGVAELIRSFSAPLFGALARSVGRRRWPDAATILADFQEHHPPGFYSTEPLERALCTRFETLGYAHHFDELPHRLYVTGADIDTGERLVFGADPFPGVHICRAVAASCAIPIFFRPIRIDDRDVVDGAIAEATPIDVAVEHGADRILYLNPLVPIRNDRTKLCLPVAGGHCGRLAEKGVGWIGEQSLRMLLAAKLENTMWALQSTHPEIRIDAIQPAREEIPMFMHNVMSFAARRELLEYGVACGLRALESGLPVLSGDLGGSDTPIEPYPVGAFLRQPRSTTPVQRRSKHHA